MADQSQSSCPARKLTCRGTDCFLPLILSVMVTLCWSHSLSCDRYIPEYSELLIGSLGTAQGRPQFVYCLSGNKQANQASRFVRSQCEDSAAIHVLT